MDILANHIREQLAHKDCCTVFRPEIARVWPKLAEMIEERNAAIQAFAAEHGWEANIVDPGIVVTFRQRQLVPTGATAEATAS
jgi:CheY-like chemotaxis protein